MIGGREGAVHGYPVLAVVGELARVACARMSAGDPPLGGLQFHHVIDVVEDDLVAAEKDDALILD